jgi:predicted nucleic acid-binding protein
VILVDSSAFIEYYRPAGSPSARARVAAAIESDQAAVNGIIQAEIVTFARDDADYRRLRSDFSAFHWLELTAREFDLASELGFALRRRGLTVPVTDLVIAASALANGATLLHLDGHFDRIAEHSELAAENLQEA